GSLEKILVKALVGGAISQAATGDFASGALAAGANEALVEHLAKLVDYDPALLASASQLVGIVAAGLTGQDAQIAANIGLHATEYNRRLHLSERQLAQELAARSNGRWSVEQIEDALRWSDSAETAESYFDGVVVRLDPYTSPYDVRDNAYDIVSNGFVVQRLDQIPLPDSELMAFIQQHTGDTYSWRPGVFPGEPADPHAGMAWTSSGYVPIRSADATDSLSYQWFYADGQAFRLPVAHCPSV
ncbi:VENN motif pre-toxin domain-containing protein, partial [Azoarcus taiwanensis]